MAASAAFIAAERLLLCRMSGLSPCVRRTIMILPLLLVFAKLAT